ncbi:MAG: hypothetical protein R3208_10545 [Ketobacteraceae bacterium]|nr:hypothetical protein [Ketobacteraceae bacterium]
MNTYEAALTNYQGDIEGSSFDVDNITNGTMSTFSLTTYTRSVSRQSLNQSSVLYQAPIPQPTTSKLKRY